MRIAFRGFFQNAGEYIMDMFYMGASYYPEWWLEEQWEDDFRKMAGLGFNAVRMGEFAWSWYEPREGEYNFEPMKRAVTLAGKYGIKTVMGTPTAVCPPWLYKKYPEVKGGDAGGDYTFGGRKGNCLSSAVFLSYAEKIVTEQAKALGGNPDIIGWQLDNEPGFPFVCYDTNCERGFREWLKEKYGTIDRLNKAWFTMMWSNVYNDFNEIDLPAHAAESGWSPAMKLDNRRYFSFTFNRLLGKQAEILRQYIGGRFIYTNWPGANWSVNCLEGASYLDYSGWDNYVPLPCGEDYRVGLRSSMEHDLARRMSSGKGTFLIAEQISQPHPNTVPEAVRAQTWLNVAHGAFATLFFEWRSPAGGQEQGYRSCLDMDGSYGESEQVLKQLAAGIQKVYPLIADAQTPSEIAAIYSYDSSWSYMNWVVDGDYDEDFFNVHGGFKNALKTNLDAIGIEDDFTKYKMVIAPNLKIVSPADTERIKKYVENGGIFVTNTDSGTRDQFNNILEIKTPGLFKELCGVSSAAGIGTAELVKQTGETSAILFKNGKRFETYRELKKLELHGAQTLAEFTCGGLKGLPAVTINSFGKGHAVYYAADCPGYLFYEELAGTLAEKFKFKPLLNAADGIIVSSRVKGGQEIIIAVNMTQSAKSFKLDTPLFDIMQNKIIIGEVTIDGFDVLAARKI